MRRILCWLLGHRPEHVKDLCVPEARECREIREVAALMVGLVGTARYCRRCGVPLP